VSSERELQRGDSLDAVQVRFSSSQHTGVLPILLATNAKHSTIGEAMKKVNLIPARPSTDLNQN